MKVTFTGTASIENALMKTQYHYQIADQVYGPVTFDELVVRVRKGTLTPGTLVNTHTQTEWMYAATVENLFVQAGQLELLEQWTAEQSDILKMRPLTPEELLQKRERDALEEQRARERVDLALAAANELISEKRPRRRAGPIRRFFAGLFSR